MSHKIPKLCINLRLLLEEYDITQMEMAAMATARLREVGYFDNDTFVLQPSLFDYFSGTNKYIDPIWIGAIIDALGISDGDLVESLFKKGVIYFERSGLPPVENKFAVLRNCVPSYQVHLLRKSDAYRIRKRQRKLDKKRQSGDNT